MFRLQLHFFFVAALVTLIAKQTHAWQTPTNVSRRSFFAKVATTGAIVVTAPGVALAAPQKKKTRTPFRGGDKNIRDTHNGTELDSKQDVVAGGLLGKMGLNDIAPDKDSAKAKSR